MCGIIKKLFKTIMLKDLLHSKEYIQDFYISKLNLISRKWNLFSKYHNIAVLKCREKEVK